MTRRMTRDHISDLNRCREALPSLLLLFLQGVEEAVDVVVLPDKLSRELRKPVEDGEGEGEEAEGEERNLIHASPVGWDSRLKYLPIHLIEG